MRRLLALLGIAAIPAACYGGMMAYIAAKENSQGEFDALKQRSPMLDL